MRWKMTQRLVDKMFLALNRIAATAAIGGGLLFFCAEPGWTQNKPAPAAKPAAAPHTAVKPPQPAPADIDRNGVLILVKSIMLALDQANKTGNYSVLRDLGSPNFHVNTPARLAEIFAWQRQQKLDLAGLVVLDPQLTLLPQIEPNGMLHFAGFFPSAPMQINFDLSFEPINREWRLFGISVQLSDGRPKAPNTPTPQSPQVSREPPKAPTAAILPANPGAGQ